MSKIKAKLISATDVFLHVQNIRYEHRIGRIGLINTDEIKVGLPLFFRYLYDTDGTPYFYSEEVYKYLQTSAIENIVESEQYLSITTRHTQLEFEILERI